MAAKKLVRDLVLLGHPLRLHLCSQPQASCSRLRLITAGGHPCNRRYSVVNEFSKKLKAKLAGTRNAEFQKSVNQLKEKAEELRGVKLLVEDLLTKQTTEQFYKHADGVWTEAKATTEKVSASVKEKTSSATEEVKEQFGIGKQEESASASGSTKHDAHAKGGSDGTSTEEKCKQAGSGDDTGPFLGECRTSFSSSSPKVSSTFQKLEVVQFVNWAGKEYDTVRDELSGSPSKRKHMDHAPTTSTVERSTGTDGVDLPSMQSLWEASTEKHKVSWTSQDLKGARIFDLVSKP